MSKPSLAPKFLYTFCIGYALNMIVDAGGSYLPFFCMAMIVLGLILGLSSASGKSYTGIILVIIFILPLAAINSVVSSNPSDSSLKWVLWIGTLFGMFLLSKRSGNSVDDQLIKNTAPAFLIIWTVLALKGNVTAESSKEKTVSLHLSAFYANLLIASAMFLPNKFWRRVLVTIGVAGALTSGSRAAFLFLPLLFLPSLIYYYRVRISTMILFGLLLTGLFFVTKNETLLALTFGRKGEEITNLDSLELAQKSAEGRGALRQIGMDYIKDKPWGYGYGQSFEVVLEGKSLGNNLHNGYLNVATQMGVHIFLIYIGFFIWLFYKLVNTGRISRRSRFFTLSILSCVFLRAISESFSLFDLGHPASFFCLFLICLFINRFNSRAEQLA